MNLNVLKEPLIIGSVAGAAAGSITFGVTANPIAAVAVASITSAGVTEHLLERRNRRPLDKRQCTMSSPNV